MPDEWDTTAGRTHSVGDGCVPAYQVPADAPTATTPRNGALAIPHPYGRRPVALRGLGDGIQGHVERELRAAAALDTRLDWSVFARAYWLRAGSEGHGWPDTLHAYVYIAPIIMSDHICEAIETIVATMRGVLQTGRGGDFDKNLRPFVYAVVDLRARQS